MDATIKFPKRCGVASVCRQIQSHWTCAERRQRRRIAEAKQQRLWRLLEAACKPSAEVGAAKAASGSGVRVDERLRSDDAL